MRYYIDMDNLKDSGNELINFSQNNIHSKYEEMLSLLNDFEWEGEAREQFDLKYKSLLNVIKDLESAVYKLGFFVGRCSDNYLESDRKISREWDVDEYNNDLKDNVK